MWRKASREANHGDHRGKERTRREHRRKDIFDVSSPLLVELWSVFGWGASKIEAMRSADGEG
jgi:hypothetical protein